MIRRKRVNESDYASDTEALYSKFVQSIEVCESDFRKLNHSITGVSKVLRDMAINSGYKPEEIYQRNTYVKRWNDLHRKLAAVELDMLNDFVGDMAIRFEDD